MLTGNGLYRDHAMKRRDRIDPAIGMLVTWTDADGRVHSRTWPSALPHHKTPCRADSSKGLAQHRCSRAHRDAVQGYHAWRDSEYAAAEAATHGYETELAEYWSAHPRPTFKAYLQGMRDETAEHAA